MKRWLLFWVLCLPFAGGCAPPASAVNTIVITNVTIVDAEGGASRPHQSVVVRNSRIEVVAPASEVRVPRGARVIDGNGKFVMPGLWDMHVHVGGEEKALGLVLAAGITGARDMGGDVTKLIEIRRRIAAGQLDGPRLVLAGPILRGPKSSSDSSDPESTVVRTSEEGRRAVESLVALGVDFIKVHDALSREAYLSVAAAARERKTPFVGHVPAAVSPSDASDAGQLEH